MATFTATQPVNFNGGFELFNQFKNITPGSVQNTTATGFDIVGATTTAHVTGTFSYVFGFPNPTSTVTEVRVFANADPTVDWYHLTLTAAVTLAQLTQYAQSTDAAVQGLKDLFSGDDTISTSLPVNAVDNPTNDFVGGFGGNDTIDPGLGNDIVLFQGKPSEYAFSAGPGGSLVVHDTVTGRDGTDQVANAEFLQFGNFGFANGQTNFGTAQSEILQGAIAATIIDGGGGVDTIDYSGLPADLKLYIDLALGFAIKGIGGLTPTSDLLGDPIQNVIGTAADDAIVGSGLDNDLAGGSGVDSIFGTSFAADGTFLPNSGNDTLSGGAGNDGLWGADGNDVLNGGDDNDGLVGGSGNDTLDGGNGDDFLFGGDFQGNAYVPTTGHDSMAGGAGNDAIYGGNGGDTISGGDGSDIIQPGTGNDSIDGGAGNNDFLIGSAGNDTVTGGAGDFDAIYGGAGSDTFVFKKGDGLDSVYDFDHGNQADFNLGEGDKLQLDALFNVTTFAQFSALLIDATTDPNHKATIIDFSSLGDVADKLTVFGVAKGDWTIAMVDGLIA